MLRSGEWKKRSTAVVDREGERQCVLVACQHADRAPVTSSLSLSLVLSALRLLFSFRSIHAETRPRWLCSSVHAATQLSFPLALTFSGTHDIMSSACAPSRSPSSRRPPPSKAPTVDRTRSRNRGSLAAFCDPFFKRLSFSLDCLQLRVILLVDEPSPLSRRYVPPGHASRPAPGQVLRIDAVHPRAAVRDELPRRRALGQTLHDLQAQVSSA